MKRTLHFIAAGFILLPLIYLLFAWPHLAPVVPLHYNLEGEVDRYGSKNELLVLFLVLTGVSAGMYVLLCNVHRIDPKKGAANKDKLQKTGVAVAIFLSALQSWILYTTVNQQSFFSIKIIFVAVGVLLSVIANYMYNLKPNYFAGIRLPWTLESEDNWRKTHYLASKLLFAAGIIIALSSIFLPFKASFFVFVSALLVALVIPVIYSYRLFKKAKM